MPYENVSFTTADGLRLEGWYIPSRNGAAVISFPGRKGPQRQARMLARHGYGVLLFDRRGEGRSDGEPERLRLGRRRGHQGRDRATCSARPDVDPARIGGIGLSVGGELMLEAAAESDAIAAVVSDGAGARTRGRGTRHRPARRSTGARGGVLRARATRRSPCSPTTLPPKHLKRLVPQIAPRPLLLIAAPNSPNGEKLNRVYAPGRARARRRCGRSRRPGTSSGIDARPAEYERRVVGFFDETL